MNDRHQTNPYKPPNAPSHEPAAPSGISSNGGRPPQPGRLVLMAGAYAGCIAGCLLVFFSSIEGVVGGVLLGVGGAVAGAFLASPIALAVNRRRNRSLNDWAE